MEKLGSRALSANDYMKNVVIFNLVPVFSNPTTI